MNCAARVESSVTISSIAVITGTLLNILLIMFEWGLNIGVEGAFGVMGICFSQLAADILTFLVQLTSFFRASGSPRQSGASNSR